MKVGLLIPTTSNGRVWKNYKETYLYNYTIKTLLLSLTEIEKKYNYIFYIGVDRGDEIFDNQETKNGLNNLKREFTNIDFQYLYMDNIKKGHLTMMWNRIYKKALYDKCDYFYQCGDDIEFKTKGWVTDCIEILKKNNNIGLTGPMNNNSRIITQSFVSRKHYELFGYFFPEEIINWFCDDWINYIYKKMNKFFPLKKHLSLNKGGEVRYDINNDPDFRIEEKSNMEKLYKECYKIVERDFNRIS
jgi:hypothetical protein